MMALLDVIWLNEGSQLKHVGLYDFYFHLFSLGPTVVRHVYIQPSLLDFIAYLLYSTTKQVLLVKL